jgi:hypothetical protein
MIGINSAELSEDSLECIFVGKEIPNPFCLAFLALTFRGDSRNVGLGNDTFLTEGRLWMKVSGCVPLPGGRCMPLSF